MKKFRSLITLTLVLAFSTSSIYGQTSDAQECEECGSAYMQSSRSAHWSAYIPIAVLVGAAIWFGLADRNSDDEDSSGSQDALGSIDNSRRHGSCVSGSDSWSKGYYRAKALSKGSYSH